MSKFFSRAYIWLVFLFLYAPMILLVIFSFNSSNSNVDFENFSFRWYIELFNDSEILSALLNTLIVATLSSLISTVIGTAAAIGIANYKKWHKKAILYITYIPVPNSAITTGFSMLVLYKALAFPTGFATHLSAHTT